MNHTPISLLIVALLLCEAGSAQTAQRTSQGFSIVAQIPVESSPHGIAVNPLTNRIYAALSNASVAVINGRTNKIITTVPLPTGALVAAVNPLTNRVYVAGCEYFPPFGTSCGLSVLDGRSNAVLTSQILSITPGIGLLGIAVNPFTNKIYVCDANSSQIDVIDGITNTWESTIYPGHQVIGLAIDSRTSRLFAAVNGPLVTVIDTKTQSVLKDIQVGDSNSYIAVNPYRHRAFVTTFSSTLGVIDTDSLQVIGTVQNVLSNSWGVAVDLLSNRAFVTDATHPGVAVVNGKADSLITTVSAPANGGQVDVNPVTRSVYVSNPLSNSVDVISERAKFKTPRDE